MRTASLGTAFLLGTALAASAASPFDYDARRPFDLKVRGQEQRGGAVIQDVDFQGAGEKRIQAYLIRPGRPAGRLAAILFVHWLDEAPNANRTQFVAEAVRLAEAGAVSLLIDAMWAEHDWFRKRDAERDYDNSLAQVRDLRRSLDLLLAQPGIDRERVAYVGHDFGAMYGSVLASLDRRPRAWAFQAATSSFALWYLLYPKRDEAGRLAVTERFAPLDPVRHLGRIAPAPVLLQFGRKDPFIPEDRARDFVAATSQPKKLIWYDAGHDLNAQAMEDRIEWLRGHLRLPSR
jgi:dienelactone hydrolase